MRRCPACGSDRVGDAWSCAACGSTPLVVDGIPLLAPAIAGGTGEDADYRYADLAAAEGRHFWFRSRDRVIVGALRRDFPAAASFLDVGCGTGGVVAALRSRLPSVRVAGAEARLAALRCARRRLPDQELLQCDVRALPWRDEFEVSGVFDVLEHLDDDEAVLREMHRATRPGGGLIVTVPQHPSLWSPIDDFSRHRRRYTRAGLARRIEAAGFQLTRMTSFMTLTLPAMLLSRAISRGATFDPARELRIGAISNAGLSALCAIERQILRTGVSLPAGGSLLAVARKPG